MEITYNSTRSDQWRCNLYMLFHGAQTLIGLLIPPMLLTIWLMSSWAKGGGWACLGAVSLAFGGWMIFNALLLWVAILQRLPSANSERICTTMISPNCFRDITPEKSADISWSNITKIQSHEGDLFLWTRTGSGSFIPRSAFRDLREGQLFFETAIAYWRNAKLGQPLPIPQDGEVWPPPPRPG